jgi:hypothetical protein
MTNFKQTPGRGNLPKTGRNIPSSMKSPEPPTDEKSGKKIGSFRTEAEIQKRYPGATAVKGKINTYKYKGATLNPGSYQGDEKSNAEQINEYVNKKKKSSKK